MEPSSSGWSSENQDGFHKTGFELSVAES